MCVCSCAIETTFPLSNFKTKHKFETFMALRKFSRPFGLRSERKQFLFCCVLNCRRRRHSRRSRKTPPKATVLRVYIYISMKFLDWKNNIAWLICRSSDKARFINQFILNLARPNKARLIHWAEIHQNFISDSLIRACNIILCILKQSDYSLAFHLNYKACLTISLF